MKKIEAIINPDLLSRVLSALHHLPHFPGVTISDVQGQGRGTGPGGKYIPHGPSWSFSKRTRLEILCTDADCEQIVHAIATTAKDGESAHGIIAVTPLEKVLRTRTSQQQDAAL